MDSTIRNRIKGHRRVRAGELVRHEFNFRTHPDQQRESLDELYREIGFARSLLVYELPDGRLKLIDGHLRQELTPEMEVDVEILDVNDMEARQLLLSMDHLAALAETDASLHTRLLELTPTSSEILRDLWECAEQAAEEARRLLQDPKAQLPGEQFLILVECESEARQVELLERFQREGLACRALVS
jgi:hypothetical protein